MGEAFLIGPLLPCSCVESRLTVKPILIALYTTLLKYVEMLCKVTYTTVRQ